MTCKGRLCDSKGADALSVQRVKVRRERLAGASQLGRHSAEQRERGDLRRRWSRSVVDGRLLDYSREGTHAVLVPDRRAVGKPDRLFVRKQRRKAVCLELLHLVAEPPARDRGGGVSAVRKRQYAGTQKTTHLKPVSVSRNWNPSFLAIDSSILDDTVDAHMASLSVRAGARQW